MIEGRSPSAVRGRRNLAALIAAALVLALLPGVAAAEDRLNMTVLEGADNVAAAIAWSQLAFPEGETVTNAILGRDDLPPDNLASGMLQGVLEGPLLLNPTNSLHSAVQAELERLEVRVVHILGGTSAISTTVENALKAEGYAVRRYSGASRLETAQDVARQHAGAATTAFLARAFGSSSDQTSAWADALAGGAWAAEEGFPVLFTQTETLTTSTRNYLTTSRIRTIIILGGTGAVSQAVEDQLKAMAITVERVSGATRFATATEIAKERGFDNAGEATSIVLADGQTANGWAAGFAAAGYAADKPIVLSNGNALPTETDTWLTGGSSTDNLIVAPYVSDAAATAAADKLGLGKTATVTLDDTSIGQGEDITGKVTPMDDVKSVAVAGEDCITDGTITPNATTGVFTLPLRDDFEPGTCDITITVTYDNNDTQAEEFTVTVTAPPATPAVLDGPELTNVTVFNQTADYVVLKYTFDEAVTLVPAVVEPGDFQVAGFDADGRPAEVDPDFGDPIIEDPDDAKSILASYFKPDYNEATTATVAAGSVADREGNLNPEGSRTLKSVTYAAGATALPDLTVVSNLVTFDQDTTTEGTDYVVRATFTFDTPATLASGKTAGVYHLMTKAGAWHEGLELVSGNGTTTHVVEFGNEAANGTFGTGTTGQTAANTFKSDVRRARVEAGGVVDDWEQPNIALTVSTGSNTDFTNVPNLTAVSLLPATDQVRYIFSAAVTGTPNPAMFFAYDHEGDLIEARTTNPAATIETANDNKSVLVTFDAGAVDGQVTGGGTRDGAVTGAKYQTRPATNAGHTFAAGATLGPDLQRVLRKANSEDDPFGGSNVTAYEVTYRFDTDVANAVDTLFEVYTPDGGEDAFEDGNCVEQTGTAENDVVCTVLDDNAALFEAVEDAVLFAVAAEAVEADDPATVYKNYATAKTPS